LRIYFIAISLERKNLFEINLFYNYVFQFNSRRELFRKY